MLEPLWERVARDESAAHDRIQELERQLARERATIDEIELFRRLLAKYGGEEGILGNPIPEAVFSSPIPKDEAEPEGEHIDHEGRVALRNEMFGWEQRAG